MARVRPVQRSAEIALSYVAATAFFAVAAVIVAAADSRDALVAAFGAVCILAVAAAARWIGVAFAVPAAIAGLVAFDWYYFPPTHPREIPDSESLGNLALYLAVAVVVGQATALAARRAAVSEAARVGLAHEQSALRRVATLVAQESSPDAVFAAVAREVGRLLDVDSTHMERHDADGASSRVASWSRDGTAPGEADGGGGASASVPIDVEGRPWGVMVASSRDDAPLPPGTEARMAAFTELVATAIANTEARTALRRLGDEQATLRRLATLVAEGVAPEAFFAAVAEEAGRLLEADVTGIVRYDGDLVATVATWARDGAAPVLDRPYPLEEWTLSPRILATGRSARVDGWTSVPGAIAKYLNSELGVGSSAGSPIVLDGRVWGALVVHTKRVLLPADAEARVEHFTELLATAMANAQARAEVRRLADEQSALRRVATLVAREPAPGEVFAAVTEEVGRLLGVQDTNMVRYEGDGTATVVARRGDEGAAEPVGTRTELAGRDDVAARVWRTGRAARIEEGPAVPPGARGGAGCWAVGCPVVVESRVWGAMIAVSRAGTALPPGIESRIGEFTELVATAISNIETRSDLAASRARIVAATDAERRRVVRDLHDGAQQRLVHTVVTLKLARRALRDRGATPTTDKLMTEALAQAEAATAELRELAHGILPSVLTRGGLRAGVTALASRTPVPVALDVGDDRLPAAVEATAYFIAAEALTNVAKHARATRAWVSAARTGDAFTIEIRDDGGGGADTGGSGLVGLADRLAVLDGTLRIESPPGGGTLISATMPVPAAPPRSEHRIGRAGLAIRDGSGTT